MAQNEMKAKPALPERVRAMEGLDRTLGAWLRLGGMGGQPFLERSIHSRLPAWACASEGTEYVGIEANGNLLFGGPLVRAACSADCRNCCSYTATKR